jgi:hypothetical protein
MGEILGSEVAALLRFSLHWRVWDETLLGTLRQTQSFQMLSTGQRNFIIFPTPSPLYTADLSENGLANQERYPAFEDVHPFQLKQVNRLSRNKVRTPEDFVSFWVHFETQESAQHPQSKWKNDSITSR